MTDSPMISTSSLARLRQPDGPPFPRSRGSLTEYPQPSYGVRTVPIVTTLHYFGPLRAEAIAAEFSQPLTTIGRILDKLNTLGYVARIPALDGFGWAWDSTRAWLPAPEEECADADEGQ